MEIMDFIFIQWEIFLMKSAICCFPINEKPPNRMEMPEHPPNLKDGGVTESDGGGQGGDARPIIVFADGECQPGECYTGTFYLDFVGVDGQGKKNGEAFFELMREIEKRYRTKAAEVID